jgi:hypothetical protein
LVRRILDLFIGHTSVIPSLRAGAAMTGVFLHCV